MAQTENPETTQVHLRLPNALYAELVKQAQTHAVSVNTVIKLRLAESVGWSATPQRRSRSRVS